MPNALMRDSEKNHKRALFVTTVPITLTSFLVPFAEMLKDEGFEVDAASANASAWPGLEVFDEVHDISWSRKISSFLRYPQASLQISRLVRAREYQIVHVHTPIAAFITRVALRRLGRFGGPAPTIIYTAHGFHFDSSKSQTYKSKLFYKLEKLALLWTDYLVVLTERDLKNAASLQISKACPIRSFCLTRRFATASRCSRNRARIMKIDGIGFDFKSYKNLREHSFARFAADNQRELFALMNNHDDTQKPLHLVAIAEINENKRMIELLDELAILKTEGIDFTFTHIGDGPLRNKFEQRIIELGLQNEVTLLGQITHEEIMDALSTPDLGLLVSKREGLPRSLMEIIAAGIPVIGTPTRGIEEEVADKSLLAPLEEHGALAALIKSLAKDRSQLKSIAAKQYAHAKETYDLPIIKEQYSRLYHNAYQDALARERRR